MNFIMIGLLLREALDRFCVRLNMYLVDNNNLRRLWAQYPCGMVCIILRTKKIWEIVNNQQKWSFFSPVESVQFRSVQFINCGWWNNGFVLHTTFLQVPLLHIIVSNSAMTVDNMRWFSMIFASQAGALQKERRKTEDLLTEMLPRSVAKQLRAGKTVQAEEYEVRIGPTSYLSGSKTVRCRITAW